MAQDDSQIKAFDSASIPYKVLTELSDRYKTKKRMKLDEDETVAVLFENNAFLREFFAQLDSKKPDGTYRVSGVRFYICQYADEPILEIGTTDGKKLPVHADYVKKLTLGFVTTTTQDEGKTHQDDVSIAFVAGAGNNGKLCPPDKDCRL